MAAVSLCSLVYFVFCNELFCFLPRRSEPDVPAGSEGGVLFPQTRADPGSASGVQ